MLRTGQLLGPASHPASRPRTGALLPGTLASPRTGLSPAGCPQLVEWLRHHNINLLVVMAPNLLDDPGSPYMKGRGRIKSLFLSIVPDSPIGVLHESARQRDVGVNVGRCPPKAWR